MLHFIASLFILIGICFPTKVHAQVSSPSLYYYVDYNDQMTYDDIRQLPSSAWIPVNAVRKNSLSLGYTTGSLWVRTQLPENTSSFDRIVEIQNPLLDQIDVYYENLHSGYVWRSMGDHRSFDDRPIAYRHFAFPLRGMASDALDVYVKIRTESSMQFTMNVYSENEFAEHMQMDALIQGLYFGMLFGLLVYNLVIFISLRERMYLFYTTWVLGIAGFFACINGYGFMYLWLSIIDLNEKMVLVFLMMCAISAHGFLYNFVNLKNHFFGGWVRGMSLVALVFLIISPFLSIKVGLQCGISIAIAAILLAVVVSAVRWYQARNNEALIFLWSFAGILLGGAVLGLERFGWVEPSAITHYSAQIGSAIEVMLISIGLALRLYRERSLREKIQTELLETTKKSQQELEIRVAERTKELEQANILLQHMSITDGLTQVYNRRHFDHLYSQIWSSCAEQGRLIGALFLDVDHFKRINDTYGHLSGDHVLRSIGKLLRTHPMLEHSIIGRYGGEEFCIIVPGKTSAILESLADELLMLIRAHTISLEDRSIIAVTASIGIHTQIPEIHSTKDDLLRNADLALYQAKKSGRDLYVVFSNS